MRPFPRRPRPPLRMLHWSRFRIRAAENSPHNPSDNAGHYRGDPVFTEHQQDLRLTSTSRPLFLKLLMRWFSKPAFSAMAVCVCVSSPCVLSRSSVQTLNPRSSEPRANRRDSIIFFPTSIPRSPSFSALIGYSRLESDWIVYCCVQTYELVANCSAGGGTVNPILG